MAASSAGASAAGCPSSESTRYSEQNPGLVNSPLPAEKDQRKRYPAARFQQVGVRCLMICQLILASA